MCSASPVTIGLDPGTVPAVGISWIAGIQNIIDAKLSAQPITVVFPRQPTLQIALHVGIKLAVRIDLLASLSGPFCHG